MITLNTPVTVNRTYPAVWLVDVSLVSPDPNQPTEGRMKAYPYDPATKEILLNKPTILRVPDIFAKAMEWAAAGDNTGVQWLQLGEQVAQKLLDELAAQQQPPADPPPQP